MSKAKYIQCIRNKYNNRVTLVYEYRGQTYFIDDNHNGYMDDPMWKKHIEEQRKIDIMLDSDKEKKEYSGAVENALDNLYELGW